MLHDSIVPKALVVLSFTQQLGGILILSITQNVFLNRLAHNLATNVPELDPDEVPGSGALGLVHAMPAKLRDQVLVAYNGALVDVFYIALDLTCLVVASTLGIKWRSAKQAKNQ